MEIQKIVFDMDGVLVDFCKSAYEVHGRMQGEDEPKCFDFFEGWGMTADQFWEPINAMGPEFWSNVPKFPWCDELVELAKPYGFVVATASSHNWASAAGKVQAMQSLFGDNFRDYAITPRKWLLGKPGMVLIDDLASNCDKFEEAGGESILFPQPWNYQRSYASDRVGYVKEHLRMIRSEHWQT